MMKKHKHLLYSGLILLIMAAFSLSSASAQEDKEEKKIFKIIIVSDEDGETNIDTTIVFDEDFEGDWKALIEDEEIEIDINVEVDEDGKIYIMSSGNTGQKYMYITEADESGEIQLEIEKMMEGMHDINIEKMEDGSTMTFIIKTDGEVDGESKNVMVWSSDGKKGKTHEIIELKGHNGAMIFMSTVMVSDIGEKEKEMLENAGIKIGKVPLNLNDLQIMIEPGDGNMKIEFTANELKNVQISFFDKNGKQLFLEELNGIDGKYIREIEIPDDKGNYFLHIKAGKESLIRKISLE